MQAWEQIIDLWGKWNEEKKKTSSESWNETPGVYNTSEKEVLEIKKICLKAEK